MSAAGESTPGGTSELIAASTTQTSLVRTCVPDCTVTPLVDLAECDSYVLSRLLWSGRASGVCFNSAL